MKNWVIVSIFALFLICGAAFAGAASVSSFDLNISGTSYMARNLSSVSINELTLASTSDLNALCMSTSDNNASDKCMYGDSFSAPIDLNYNIISGFSSNTPSDGNYTLYIYLKQDDGNFSASLSKSLKIDNVAPLLSGAYPVSGTDYDTNSFTFDLNVTDPVTAIGTPIIKLDGNARGDVVATSITNGKEFKFTVTGMTDGNHTVSIDVNDAMSNNLNSSYTFSVDTNAPTVPSVTSSYKTSYTNSAQPSFTLSATELGSGLASGKVALSCSGSAGKWQEFTYASTISTFNITVSTYDCNTSDGNKTIYAKLMDKAGNWSNTATSNVLYDNTAPSIPTGLSASAGDLQISLTWTAPAADNLSGNAGYKVYKNGTVFTTVTTTSATVTGLTNGTSYDFKVSTYDNAGNEGTASSTISATPSGATSTITVTDGSNSVSYAKGGTALTISCSFSKSVDAARIKYRYYNPTQDSQTLSGPTNGVTSLSANLTISSTSYERIEFWCEGTSSIVITSQTANIVLDNTAPTVSWVDSNNTFVGMKRVIATASDNLYLEKVEFLFQGVYFQGQKDSNSNFYADINSLQYENGTYAIKAVATDKAGNKKELSRDVTVSNLQSDYQKAQKMIGEAKIKQQSVNDLMNYFNSQGLVFSSDLTTQKTQADQLLTDAQSTAKADSKGALDKATRAKAIYETINKSAAVSTVEANSYTYTLDSLIEKLRAAGLSEALIEQARQNITDSKIERVLNVVRVGDTNSYQASISITFTNDTNGDTVKIVEVIPKELVASAKKIFSDFNFTIIQDDPIIEFVVPATKGAKTTITYGIGEITKEQADALTTNNVVAKFSAPPIMLAESADTKTAFGPSAGQMLGWIFTIVGIIVLIAIIVGAAIFLEVRLPNSSNKFGEKKSLLKKMQSGSKKAPEKKKWQHK